MTRNIDRVEVITSVRRRRRLTEEKAAIGQKTYASGMSVSLVDDALQRWWVIGQIVRRDRRPRWAPGSI